MSLRFGGRMTLVVGLVTVAAAALAACGSGDSGSSNSQSDPSQKFQGEPVVIGITGLIDSNIGDYKQLYAGAFAAARALNAKGGIKGHEVKIETCNGKGDPNLEVACARQVVSSKAIAMAGNLVISNDVGVLSILEKGGVASIAATSPQVPNYQYKNSFTIDFTLGQWAQCVSKTTLQLAGAKEPGRVVGELPINKGNDFVLSTAAKVANAGPAGAVVIPLGSTDLAPLIPKVESLGTNLLVVNTDPRQIGAYVAAIKPTGKKYTYCSFDGLLSGGLIRALAGVSDDFVEGTSLPPLTAEKQFPVLKRFKVDMKAEQDSGDDAASLDFENYTSGALRSWTGVNIIADIAKKLPDPTDRAAFFKALSESTHVSTGGLYPPLDFTQPQSGGPYSRVFNAQTRLIKYDQDKKDMFLVQGAGVANGLQGLGF